MAGWGYLIRSLARFGILVGVMQRTFPHSALLARQGQVAEK